MKSSDDFIPWPCPRCGTEYDSLSAAVDCCPGEDTGKEDE